MTSFGKQFLTIITSVLVVLDVNVYMLWDDEWYQSITVPYFLCDLHAPLFSSISSFECLLFGICTAYLQSSALFFIVLLCMLC